MVESSSPAAPSTFVSSASETNSVGDASATTKGMISSTGAFHCGTITAVTSPTAKDKSLY